MPKPGKRAPLKSTVKLVDMLKGAIRKSREKRKLNKAARKSKRKDRIYKIRGKVDEFMKAAFEPKAVKTARRKKKKLERKTKKKPA